MKQKKKKVEKQHLDDNQANETPKRTSSRKRSTIKYKESDSEEEEVVPKKSRLSKDIKGNGATSKNKSESKSACDNATPKKEGNPKKKAKKVEASNVKKTTKRSKAKTNSDAYDDISDECEDVDSDYENDSSSDSESEIDENDDIISKTLIINENAFKEEFKIADNLLIKELKFLINPDKDDLNALMKILKENLPNLIKTIDGILEKIHKMHLSVLNNNSRYASSVLEVFAYCVKTFKRDYDYENFFTNEKFDDLVTKYLDYLSYDRKLNRIARAGISADNETIVTKDLCVKTIKLKYQLMFTWIKILQCKISKETLEIFKSLPFRADDINAKRKRGDLEEMKWPLTLFDLNWYLHHHPIADEKGLMAAALISLMTYLGIRMSTLRGMFLKDMMITQMGRKVSQILFTLIWLKEGSESKKVFIPGNLKPLDAAGLLIMYLDTRKVFEAGLDEQQPSFIVKSDCLNEPLFLFSNTAETEIKNFYQDVAKGLGAPKFAISSRSSRKGHCIERLLRTKTIYPAMPVELLEEDLISMGTWIGKKSMRHYLKGGCEQALVTCNRIENLETPLPSFDAKEYHLYLVDALHVIKDWTAAENNTSVLQMIKKMKEYGAKKNTNKKSLAEHCQELVSSINFYKKVKALELNQDELPKIAINVLPKVVNLEHGYYEGGEVFSQISPHCETCKSVCIREKPAIENFNAFSFKADKKFYLKMKGLDDNEYEKKMVKQFTTDANQQKCLLKLFQDWSIEK